MKNMGFERRKNDRVIAKDLPDSLKEFQICLGAEESIVAKTLDISSKGIGLSVPLSVKDITSIFITICSLDQNIKIKEQILSVRCINEKTSRVSIMFAKQNPFFDLAN
jgi:cell shape-determining protein MreC